MDKQIKTSNNDSHRITTEKALELFVDKYLELHPKESSPKWFFSHTDMGQISSGEANKLRFAFMALKKKELGLNEWYEEVHGKEVLAVLNPETQKKEYVISIHESEILIIFEAVVDLETAELTILTDRDLLSINSEDLRKLR
jgi:hypothetical protein